MTRARSAWRFAWGTAALALCTAAAAAPVDVTDDLGHRLHFDAPPRRIVTLLPSLTESVCALGGCDRLVGVDRYSNYPAQAARLPRLGGLDDVQVESLVALRPDVVVAAPSSRVQQRLGELGLKVLVLQTRTPSELRHGLDVLGALLARPDPQAVWRAIDAGLAQAAAQVPAGLRGARVYFEVDSAPYAAGASSFIGATLARLGLRDIVGPEWGPFPKLNPEFVVRADPQLVMIGAAQADGLRARPGWAGITALRTRSVCAFDRAQMDLIIRPGPRLAEGARAIVGCLRTLGARR